MGTVVPFPLRPRRQFTAEMLAGLVRLAARTPDVQPLWFGTDTHGSEFCRFANGIMVGWDRGRRLVLTDTVTGYVDHGPFDSLDDVCFVITSLAAGVPCGPAGETAAGALASPTCPASKASVVAR